MNKNLIFVSIYTLLSLQVFAFSGGGGDDDGGGSGFGSYAFSQDIIVRMGPSGTTSGSLSRKYLVHPTYSSLTEGGVENQPLINKLPASVRGLHNQYGGSGVGPNCHSAVLMFHGMGRQRFYSELEAVDIFFNSGQFRVVSNQEHLQYGDVIAFIERLDPSKPVAVGNVDWIKHSAVLITKDVAWSKLNPFDSPWVFQNTNYLISECSEYTFVVLRRN